MPQRFKVRLSDGTFMAVDLDGLRAWANDAGALAQAVGSQQWRSLRDVLAEEENALRLLRALVPPQPRQTTPAPAPEAPAAPAWEPPPAPEPWQPPPAPEPWQPPPAPEPWQPPPAPEPWQPPPAPEPWQPPPASEPPALSEPPSFAAPPAVIGEPANLQVLADEPVAAHSGGERLPASDDVLPAIRMKPLDDEPRFRSAWDEGGEPEQVEDEGPHQDRLEGPLLTVLETVGGFLSRVLDRLTPLVSGVSFGTSGERATRGERRTEAREELRTDAVERPSLFARASDWLRGLRAREAEAEPEEPPAPAPPPAAKAVPSAKARPSLLPPEPVQTPPPAVKDLPAIPFAPSREPRERVDVYEGDREPLITISLGPLWYWTKRIVVLGGLVALGAYGWLERDTWFPKAADVGQKAFTELDRQVLSRQRNEQQRQALAAASERLPQLLPATIQLFFAHSPTGIAGAPEVFELAREAADRGRGALAPAEAEELRALERALVGALQPVERQLVLEYDRTRARRPVFAFENPHVMELVAQGARLLPPERRARLQALTHQAVLAGIDLPAATPAPAAAR